MMLNERFFDQTLTMIHNGAPEMALSMLSGQLFHAHALSEQWAETRESLRNHALFRLLQEDPFSAHSNARPRGYPGDAALIDLIYDQVPPAGTSEIGASLFNVTISAPAGHAVRQRREYAQTIFKSAWDEGKRICVLACGHLREVDALAGQDFSQVTLVDQDPISLDVVRAKHGGSATIIEANVFRYLRAAAARGDRFDLVYTLGLTDYLDAKAMGLLHRLVSAVLAPGGTFLLANFLPAHISLGWMDAVMDWHLIYRDEHELELYATNAGLIPVTWRDTIGAVVWCNMKSPA
jgi:extracellular factor (EF) 3-hydroxypalmitic acid methyl ester biosynthesis protein